MKKLPSLTVFFPVYNEAQNIPRLLRSALKLIPSYAEDFEILVINDGSTDDTAKIVRRIIDNYPSIRLISHPQNLGYGAAIKTGLCHAQKEWVFFCDGDGQFSLNDLPKVLSHAKKFPVVTGYRLQRSDPLHRLIYALAWRTLNYLLYGLKVKDVNCAYKLFHRPAISGIILHSTGAMISAELMICCQNKGLTIKEVPVRHFSRQRGKQTGGNFKVISKAIKEIIILHKHLVNLRNNNYT